MFAAMLKLNKSIKECRQRVNEVIEELNLTNCRKTLIGNNFVKGCSGGERKRVSIGVELITNPSVIFCDEPTSGLDAFTSETIVKILKAQACRGKIVLSTIHQPSSSTFALFDQFILMQEGRIIY
jgi:ABC-type multidrug transport system ATPase subunit